MAHSENKWFKSIYGEEKVTAASCPSEGEWSPHMNWKPLQGNTVQHQWNKCFYFHIKWHNINLFSGMTPFVSWMHHIKDDLLVGYKPTALHQTRLSSVNSEKAERTSLTWYWRNVSYFLASWTVHFVNTCEKNQQMHQLFILFINYVW
jgi:hypothetical protein